MISHPSTMAKQIAGQDKTHSHRWNIKKKKNDHPLLKSAFLLVT